MVGCRPPGHHTTAALLLPHTPAALPNRYQGSGKQFFIGMWEGDHALRPPGQWVCASGRARLGPDASIHSAVTLTPTLPACAALPPPQQHT
jgi:hypothetical protein